MTPARFVVALILLMAVHRAMATGYPEALCLGRQFSCKGIKKCVPLVKVCDGHDDCGDNSDEHGCGRTNRGEQKVSSHPSRNY
ncbi:hypothetical protein BsWGS_12120 [Bradybaena similaris]